MNYFPFFLYMIYGLAIGSFLNVVIYRLPINLSIARGRSMCPKCQHTLSALDLFPLFSFLFLRGKCRYCKTPISWRYPAIELLSGLLFGLCGTMFGLTLYSVLLCLFFSILVVAWFIDLDLSYIPDRLHIIIIAIAICSYFVGPEISIIDRLIGGIGIGIVMFLISFLTGGGVGGGDIKLMAASGLLLGWQLIVPAFFMAYVIAAIRWVPPYLSKKISTGFEVPMAPYFAIALMIMALFGEQLISAYISLLSF